MHSSTWSSRRVSALAFSVLCLAATAGVRAQGDDYRNVTAGGPLRPGIYGRIVVKGQAAPPPVIYPSPVIATDVLVPRDARPVYLYVPPGQVRKWKQNCAKWNACDEPVLFVRVDSSPSQWGRWKQLREPQLASFHHE